VPNRFSKLGSLSLFVIFKVSTSCGTQKKEIIVITRKINDKKNPKMKEIGNFIF
tara:strand:+ start:403 stop:564 length:162 start_codon:yes stop_codon:yes gene_type:complete